jgi:hypothetical protein
MFITQTSTGHFDIIAAGETEAASRQAWADGFRAHLASYGPDPIKTNYRYKTWKLEHYDGMEPIEWFDPATFELKPGQCLRDHDLILEKAS